MTRSEINTLIRDSLEFFEKCRFRLPIWATWSPEQWEGEIVGLSKEPPRDSRGLV